MNHSTQPTTRMVIAIDGTSASGKSTAARQAAKRLGYLHVDSGALYRAISWKVLSAGIHPHDTEGVKQLLARLTCKVDAVDNKVRIQLDGAEPSEADIRNPEVTAATSVVCAIPEVRALVNAKLRALAAQHNVVVEGRDIGTVVFPNAAHKFYLTADPAERAKRRKQDFEILFASSPSQSAPPQTADVEKLKAALTERDHKDSSRAIDPLRVAPDAVVIDTTPNTPEQTEAQIIKVINAAATQRNKESAS